MDQDLATLFNYLDAKVGKGQYLFFITADHGVAHVPGFMTENKLPGGTWDDKAALKDLNTQVAGRFGVEGAVEATDNYQFWLNHDAITRSNKNEEEIKQFIIAQLLRSSAIAKAFEIDHLMTTTLPEPMRTMLSNGFNTKRSGDIQVVLSPGYIDGGNTGTTHGLWYPYDAHIPLVWMGWGIQPGKTNRTVGMTDITPTLAALLHIQMPSGNVGQVIQEITH